MEKTLTITIPAYNVSEYLPEVIPTFLQPEVMGDIEILIVNDGSKDNTKQIAEKYQEKYPNVVRVINKENGGHGSTINRGISEAKGKYFKIVDGDDWVDPASFVTFVKELKEIDADVVHTPYNCVFVKEGRDEIKSISDIEKNEIYRIDEVINKLGDCYAMHSLTYKTDVAKKMRQITENCFYVDQEYVCFSLEHADNIIFLDSVVYQYRLGIDEQSMNIKKLQKNRKMHARVTDSICSFILDYENKSREVEEFLVKRAKYLFFTQIFIYLMMPIANETMMECKEFIKLFKSKYGRIYSSFSKHIKIVATLSTSHMYSLLSIITKFLYRFY